MVPRGGGTVSSAGSDSFVAAAGESGSDVIDGPRPGGPPLKGRNAGRSMSTFSADLAFVWNPAIGLPEASALALVFVVTALWLAWRGNSDATARLRWPLLGLRTLGLIALAL